LLYSAITSFNVAIEISEVDEDIWINCNDLPAQMVNKTKRVKAKTLFMFLWSVCCKTEWSYECKSGV